MKEKRSWILTYRQKRLAQVVGAIVICALLASTNFAQSTTESKGAQKTNVKNTDQKTDESLSRLLTGLARQHIPHTYSEDKDWGKQAERWSGIRFRREGFRIETKRKKKLVNHGVWKKYSAELINPKEQFSISVQNLTGKDGKLFFELQSSAAVKLHGRQAKWAKGVQLYSISADANATIDLTVHCELDIDLDFSKLPPDVIFKPKVTKAKIVVQDFKVDRISKVGGEIAQQLSRAVRRKLDDKIKRQEEKLVTKLNKAIAKKQDRLKISFKEASDNKYAELAKPLLDRPIQKAIEKYGKKK